MGPFDLGLIPVAGAVATINGLRWVATGGEWEQEAAAPAAPEPADLSFHAPPVPVPSITGAYPFGIAGESGPDRQFIPVDLASLPPATGGAAFTQVEGYSAYQFGVDPKLADSLAGKLGAEVVQAGQHVTNTKPLELTMDFGGCAHLNAGLVVQRYLMYPAYTADLMTRAEVAKECGSDEEFVPLDAGSNMTAGRLATITAPRPAVSLPTFAPAPLLAQMQADQGYNAAWLAARSQLASGTATERAIAETGEFRLIGGGQVQVTGIVWQSLLPATGTPAVAPPRAAHVIRPEFVAPAPIITGEPISTGIIIGIQVLAALFGIFGGGVSDSVKTALEGLRGAIATVSSTLTRGLWQAARGLGRVLAALSHAWVRVIAPMLRRLLDLTARFGHLVNRVLRSYFHVLEKIRKIYLDFYERYARRVLLVIQRTRQVLAVLKVFRVPFARQIDERLAGIESRIIGTLQLVLARINILGGWVNTILTGGLLIQQPIFSNSLYAYQGDVVNLVLNGLENMAVEPGKFPSQVPVSSEQLRAEFRQFALSNTGPMAELSRRFNAELERLDRMTP